VYTDDVVLQRSGVKLNMLKVSCCMLEKQIRYQLFMSLKHFKIECVNM